MSFSFENRQNYVSRIVKDKAEFFGTNLCRNGWCYKCDISFTESMERVKPKSVCRTYIQMV